MPLEKSIVLADVDSGGIGVTASCRGKHLQFQSALLIYARSRKSGEVVSNIPHYAFVAIKRMLRTNGGEEWRRSGSRTSYKS
jgi:hypothetical protein